MPWQSPGTHLTGLVLQDFADATSRKAAASTLHSLLTDIPRWVASRVSMLLQHDKFPRGLDGTFYAQVLPIVSVTAAANSSWHVAAVRRAQLGTAGSSWAAHGARL